jgi:acetyl esterase
MARFIGSIAAGIALAGIAGAGAAQSVYPLDDSYTVSSRYIQNSKAHPEFSLPELRMVEGQKVLFDRLYRKVGNRELHIDVFLPPPALNRKVGIVLIHGGAWRSGNKSNFYAIAGLLAQRGYAVFLPEFRLAPEARYPAGMTDINAAVSWVADHAAEFAIDPGALAIGGESSGGQMASLAAFAGGTTRFTTDGQPSRRVGALIDIDGVLDFTTPLALQFENAAGPGSSAAMWLGGSWEEKPDVWREASAATYVGPQSPPTLVISGEHPRCTAGVDRIMLELAKHGITGRREHYAGMPHAFWLFEPYASRVSAVIDDFLQGIELSPVARFSPG